MTPDARMVLEAFLLTVKPSHALYIGSEIGRAVERISVHSERVYALEAESVVPPNSPLRNLTTRSRTQQSLRELLREITQEGNAIDLVFIDREQSARGVRRDLHDLLLSPCVAHSIILIHDTLNERVRAGLEQVAWESFEAVRFFDADFVAGRLFSADPLEGQLWGGLGLVLTGSAVDAEPMRLELEAMPEVFDAFLRATVDGSRSGVPRYHQVAQLERQVAELKAAARELNASVASLLQSRSWRLTEPLRRGDLLVRRIARRRRHPRS
jgi:hypothetical protein